MIRHHARRALLGIAPVAAGVLAAAATGGATSTSAPRWALHGPYAPSIRPADFTDGVDNPFFPLKPGTAFHYEGVSDGVTQTDDMVVTHRTKQVEGVQATVVRDTVSARGIPIERTFDWYAQDKQGNVWYMGEDSLEMKNGRWARASDSWTGGVHGGKPGIIMPGAPKPGAVYRQEYYRAGGALDQARVLSLNGKIGVRYGTYKHVLVTLEWSPVEPQLEQKYYVRGIGEVQEHLVQGGHESFRLVSLTH